MTHSSEEVWAVDDGRHGRVGDHTTHGSYTDPADAHDLHAAWAILGCGPTELHLQQICCGSYSVIVIQLSFDLLLPGAML